MKVKELIDKLGQYDEDDEVYISSCAYPGYVINDVNKFGDIIEIK